LGIIKIHCGGPTVGQLRGRHPRIGGLLVYRLKQIVIELIIK
jgi:hypothetical protein